MKTLQECKDEIAIKHNLHSWDNACYIWAGFVKRMEPFMDEAAELYASQYRESGKPEPVEQEEIPQDVWLDYGKDEMAYSFEAAEKKIPDPVDYVRRKMSEKYTITKKQHG